MQGAAFGARPGFAPVAETNKQARATEVAKGSLNFSVTGLIE